MMKRFYEQFSQKHAIIDVWQGAKYATDNSQKIVSCL